MSSDNNTASMEEEKDPSPPPKEDSAAPKEDTAEEPSAAEEEPADVPAAASGLESLVAAADVEETAKKEEPSEEEEEEAAVPTTYSTRGRAQEDLAAVGDLLSMSGMANNNNTSNTNVSHKQDALLSRMRESFLSDSLTEEERRTRTRFLPDVEGMNALRKSQVKGDLALARSTTKFKQQRKASDDEDDEGEDAGSGNNNKTTDASLPSPAFVAPPPPTDSHNARPSPAQPEAVAAFNPPRPQESVGAKKKHRLLRWERRPSDIEVDLANYRKTVERTREEWVNATIELETRTTVQAHVRRHFLAHVRALQAELADIAQSKLPQVQQELVDLTTTTANIPGATRMTRAKGSNAFVVRDAIHALRAKGKALAAGKKDSVSIPTAAPLENAVAGSGGVAVSNFRESLLLGKVAAASPAPWLVNGETFVDTPYGKGTVVASFGPTALNPRAESTLYPKSKAVENADAMDVDDPGAEAAKKRKTNKRKGGDAAAAPTESLKNVLAPRVAVRLPFGLAFFNMDSIVSTENPAGYSDEQLAARWKGLVENAADFGSTIDVAAMTESIAATVAAEATADQMEVDSTDAGTEEEDSSKNERKRKILPFGSTMFPTRFGRGTNLHKISTQELEAQVRKIITTGGGVLGNRDLIPVPPSVREMEDEREENLDLQAKVLQLRNQLYRQRRIRTLNERTYTATQERASRVESLVAEMRTDLKSLKGRLDLEIRDLGVSEKEAESILTSFYMSLDSQHLGEASPPKRPRRASRLESDLEDEVGTDEPGPMQLDSKKTDEELATADEAAGSAAEERATPAPTPPPGAASEDA